MDASSALLAATEGGPMLPTLLTLSGGLAARAIAAAGDVSLVIDGDGVIVDLATGSDDLAAESIESWIGRRWVDTVCIDSKPKIGEMLAAAAAGEATRWRVVNHMVASGELPIRYVAVGSGEPGQVIAIGRDMRAVAAMQQRLIRAQQALERDSMSLRQTEARYRLLFETSTDAIIIVDTVTRRVVEANPLAHGLAGHGTLEGQAFSAVVHPDDRDAALALIGAVAAAEQTQPARIRLAGGITCLMAATLFRQDRGTFLLLRLTEASEGPVPALRSLGEVLDRIPDPFVLTDADLIVLAKNSAFLELVHQPRGDNLRGQPLGRFVGRPGIDLGALAAQLRDHGAVRNFATIVRDARGNEEEVEISAVGMPDGDGMRYGFSIRPISRRRVDAGGGATLPRSVEQLTELVGRVSLKEIVRESTDLIERLCIEAALAYTADNRASAAEILGLSRQSLYSKLHRHGLGNLVPDAD